MLLIDADFLDSTYKYTIALHSNSFLRRQFHQNKGFESFKLDS